MRLYILGMILALGTGSVHANQQEKVSCRGTQESRDEQLSQLQRFLPPGSKVPEGRPLVPTYDLNEMMKNLPVEDLVNDEAVAVALGQIILARVFGEKIIEREKPFEALLINNDVWVVKRKITDEMVENCIFPTISHSVAIRKGDGAVLGVQVDK